MGNDIKATDLQELKGVPLNMRKGVQGTATCSMRADRIAALRSAVQLGSYKVDTALLAEKLIQRGVFNE